MTRKSIGINTFDDLKDRCVIDEVTGCWHYKGAFTRKSATGTVTATCWYPPIQRSISVAKAIGLMHAKAPGKGKLWYRCCRTWDCANPAHHKIGTRSEMAKHCRPSNTPLHNAQISAAQRRLRGLPGTPMAAGSSIFNLAATMGGGQ